MVSVGLEGRPNQGSHSVDHGVAIRNNTVARDRESVAEEGGRKTVAVVTPTRDLVRGSTTLVYVGPEGSLNQESSSLVPVRVSENRISPSDFRSDEDRGNLFVAREARIVDQESSEEVLSHRPVPGAEGVGGKSVDPTARTRTF